VKLKDQLEQDTNAFDEKLNPTDLLASKNSAFTDLSTIEELIKKLKTVPDLQKLLEAAEDVTTDFMRVKQLLIGKNLRLTDEIEIVRDKIKDRNEAISSVVIERDNLKAQMKDIIEEIVGQNL